MPQREERKNYSREAAIVAGAAGVYTQRERILGVRTLYHGRRNAPSRGFRIIKKGKIVHDLKREARALYKDALQKGIRRRFGGYMAVPGKPEKGTSVFQGRHVASFWSDAKTEFVDKKAVIDRAKEGYKQIIFASTKKKTAAGFSSISGKRKPVVIKVGEEQFKKQFVAEKSFDLFDDHYHRPLKPEWYKDVPKVQPGEYTNRYQLDVAKGARETRKRFVKDVGKVKKSIADIPKQWKDPYPFWDKKTNPIGKRRFELFKDVKFYSRITVDNVSPLSRTHEASYYTFKDIKPRHVKGSKHFKYPLSLRNMLVSPKRFLLGVTIAAGAATVGYVAGKMIAKPKKKVVFRRIKGRVVPIRIKK